MKRKNKIQESLLKELRIAKYHSAMLTQVEVKQAKELDEKDKTKEKLIKEIKLVKEKVKDKDAMIKH